MTKIFLSIVSYQDPSLIATIESAYINAKNKDSIVFAIVDQSSSKSEISDLDFVKQLKYVSVDPMTTRGACWARAVAQTLITDENYYMQVDSHTLFDKNWDEYFLDFFTTITAVSDKPIITSYPRAFEIIDLNGKVFKKTDENDKTTHGIVLREDQVFSKGYYSTQKGISIGSNDVVKGFLVSAGCLFTSTDFTSEVIYDPVIYFEGEELSIALRSFTRGYDIFHTPDVPVYHYYVGQTNTVKRPLHWDENENTERLVKWSDRQTEGEERLTNLVNGKVKGLFGLGETRSLDDYMDLSGIDLTNKKIVNKQRAFNFSS